MSSNVKEKIFEVIFLLTALVSLVAVIIICIFLFANGVPAMFEIGFTDFIFGEVWRPGSGSYGIFPMIVGSIYITAGAILFGVPIGILTAIFLARFCSERLQKIIKPAIDILAGIPSIIYGFFGMIVLVPMVRNIFNIANGSTILTASVLLGIMILPTIIGISQTALKAVPSFYYEGAVALGASHERAVFTVQLPAAKSGIMASVVLGIGRAIGETMAVIMVAGNQPRLTNDVLTGIRTLTANVVMEMGYAADLHREALIATGVVLFVFVLIINATFSILKRRSEKKS